MDPHQFNLRWNNHSCNIVQVFMEQLTSESLVDVTLSCQGQFIKAHKMVLSACSPYFQDLFNEHQVQHPVIILNGVKFKDLKMIVEFMYRGEARVLESELGGIFSVAEALQIKGLCSVRNKYTSRGPLKSSSTHLFEDSIEGEDFPDDSSHVTVPHPTQFRDAPVESSDPFRKRKHNPEMENASSSKISRNEELAELALTETTHQKPPMTKSTPPVEIEKSAKCHVVPGNRSSKVYPSRKSLPKKSSKSSKSMSFGSPNEENTEVLPFVQVSLNEADDDDIDLTSAIKVNPLFIRDIDDTDTSWDDPSRLVIDLPPEETEGKKDNGTSQDLISSSIEESNKSSAPKQIPKLKVRATSELVSSSKSFAASKSSVSSAKSTCKSVSVKSSAAPDGLTFYKKQQFLIDQLKERTGQPPRPPNAFMIFANEWRRKLAVENPSESNKQISVRLGLKWKALTPENKNVYYSASKRATEEHKIKYPNYIYSPKEARLRKALLCSLRHQMSTVPKESSSKASGDTLIIKNNVGKSSSDSSMTFMESSELVIKEEFVEDESGTQNMEEDFFKMVEGHVEGDLQRDGGGSRESAIQGGDQVDSH